MTELFTDEDVSKTNILSYKNLCLVESNPRIYLQDAFTWRNAPQGFTYWYEISTGAKSLSKQDIAFINALIARDKKDSVKPFKRYLLKEVEGVLFEDLHQLIRGQLIALDTSFEWVTTEQGFEYWQNRDNDKSLITNQDLEYFKELYDVHFQEPKEDVYMGFLEVECRRISLEGIEAKKEAEKFLNKSLKKEKTRVTNLVHNNKEFVRQNDNLSQEIDLVKRLHAEQVELTNELTASLEAVNNSVDSLTRDNEHLLHGQKRLEKFLESAENALIYKEDEIARLEGALRNKDVIILGMASELFGGGES